MSQLSEAIKEITKEQMGSEKIYSQICKVISIDEDKRTCQVEPINGDAERKARIQASLELKEGIYIKPKLESFISLSFINELTGVITSYSEIDFIQLIIGDSIIEIEDGLIKLNKGELGGVPISQNTTDRLNLIEDDINALKQAFTSWVVAPQDGGLALKTAAATWYGSVLMETKSSDLENDKFKQ